MESKRYLKVVAGVILVALSAALLASLATHRPYEGPFPDFAAEPDGGNACGVAGAYASAYGLALMGHAFYVVAAAIGLTGVMLALGIGLPAMLRHMTGLAVITAALVLGLAIFNAAPGSTAGSYRASSGTAGGALGILLAGWLYTGVGATGAFILFVLCCFAASFLIAGAQMTALSRRVVLVGQGLGARVAGAFVPGRRGRKPAASEWPDAEADEPVWMGAARVDLAAEREPVPLSVLDEPDEFEERIEDDEPSLPEPELVTSYSRSQAADDDGTDYSLFESVPREGHGEYTLPPVTLLDRLAAPLVPEDESDVREKGRILEGTLREFGIGARVVAVRRGPVITMYELSLAPGTKVSRVESLSNDLAIALKAPNVRIVAPLPGRNTVGIEVPNTEREIVGVRELMGETRGKYDNLEIPLFLGKDTAGNPLVLDLATCPHLLVAGATGSGKSVAINAMISSILMTRTPDEVQLLLIDPKSVEFSDYTQLPHLICPVLTDMKKAASVLKWACKKMDDRYALLAGTGVRDLKSYNALGQEEIRRRLDPEGDAVIDDVPFYMPHIVIIVDEFGELMMVAAKEVEGSVIRLSQKARAVGIHLICATQRPSADVITGLIKSNLPARIAFQVAAMVDSRTILDRNGAEVLLGRGDMLLLPPGTSRLVRAQGSYVSEAEVRRVVEFLEEQAGPQFKAELQEYQAHQRTASASDDLYEDAVRVVVETQRGSVSLLQRRLSIGFSRAARLIDMMAEAGVVGPYAGSQARRVMMTLEQWDRARAQN